MTPVFSKRVLILPDRNLERISTPGGSNIFTNFCPAVSTADDGTGVGLTIVNEIVEAHGWEIRVTDSEIGGACFEIIGIETAH